LYCNTYNAIYFYPQAPVSGSKKPAEDGQLIFLTAGEYYYSTSNKLIQFGMGKLLLKRYLLFHKKKIQAEM